MHGLAAASLTALLVPAAAQSWREPALASFDLVWQTIHETYYDPSFGGLDWGAVRDELRPEAVRATSPQAVREVIGRMLARLGQSHFALLPATATRESLPGEATVAIDVRVFEPAEDAPPWIVVTRVEPGSPAAAAGLLPGDIVDGVDDTRVEDWRARAGTVPTGVRGLELWRQATRALHGRPGSVAAVSIRRTDGLPARVVNVERTMQRGNPVTIGNLPPLRVRADAREAVTPQQRRAGVIAFNLWLPPINAPVETAIDRFRGADGLVVDLRGNAGGLAEMMRGIAGHVLDEPRVLGRMQTRTAALEFAANPRRSRSDGRTVEPFAGPVAILVDELTGSTSECFAGGLQDLGRARVFGRRTMGQALPAVTKGLPSGDTLMYVLGDFVTSTGRRLEGAGVVPDEPLRLDLRALAQGRDRDLEAALTWIDRAGSRMARK
jgi:carboxyl-terminal processing protease